MSAWVEDPREPSGWRWDSSAPDGDPTVTSMLPIVPAPYLQPIEYGGRRDYAVHPAPADLVNVPPRVDDWCEDRPVGELTEDDGQD